MSGNNFSLILPNVDTINFNVYLEHFSQYLKLVGKKAVLVMDGAGWHKSKRIKRYSNIEFMFQPSYSPEINPVEKLWQYIKRHTIKNRLFRTLDEIENEICNFITQITKDKYMSVCRAEYINT